MSTKFGDDSLIVTKATISARASNPSPGRPCETPESALYWHIEIDAYLPFEHDGMQFSDFFRFYHESLQIPDKITKWTDLAGLVVTWDGSEKILPRLYLDSHIDLTPSTLRFVECEGRNIRIRWNSTVTEMNFSIDCWALFEGIDVHCNQEDDAETIRSIFAAHLDPEDFIQHPKQPAGGIAWFEPKS